LYIAVIILIIPAIVSTPPAILWTNGVIDLQGFCMMILAIVCSIMAVIIFRESRDDGTELIIMSKPINRWKIILVKFISYLLTSAIVIAGGVILMLCTLFFGKYSPTHLDGIDYSVLPGMIGGLVLAGVITILLFGAVAILISAFAGKVVIMITTIGIAIIIYILQQVLPFAATTPSSYIKNNYSMELKTHRAVGTDGKMHNSFNAEHVATIDDVRYDSLFYANEGLSHATGAIACYANVGQQITNLYHAFSTKEESVTLNTPFGSKYDKKYTITNNKNSIFQDANGSETNKEYGNSNVP
jgi:ABC-type transport system involved in multi-copper enzyme maturation permease subunit